MKMRSEQSGRGNEKRGDVRNANERMRDSTKKTLT